MAAARPRTTTPEGHEQRERILRAATELFAAHGFRGASLDAVAAKVGISRQGVLHYFPSKTHLLLGVLDLRDEDDAARVEERFGTAEDFVDGLLALVQQNQQAPDLPRLFTVLTAESVDPQHPGHEHFRERYQTVRAALTFAVEAAQASGQLNPAVDPASLATVLVAVMDGLQLQFLLDPEAVDMLEPLAGLLSLLLPPE